MKKVVLCLFIVVMLVLQGCSSEEYEPSYYTDEGQTVSLADETSPERKIIYQVDMYANVNDLDDALTWIKNSMEEDEWLDQETINPHSIDVVIRIRSDRLEWFVETMKSEFIIESYQMKATDISLNYQDKTSQIEALDAQIERLIELYNNASLSDMIKINEQLSNLEVARRKLQGELNLFDSLSDYSEINLTLYRSVVVTKSPFIQRLGRAFTSGWNGLVQLTEGIILLLATTLPFLVLMGGVAFGCVIYIKKRNKKIDLLKQKKA